MYYNYTPRRLWSRRCLILFFVLILVLLIYALNGPVWDILEPVMVVSVVHNTKINRLNNSSQEGVLYMNGQKMNSQNNSIPKRVTDMNNQKMNRMINSGQQGVTDSNSQKMNSQNNSSQKGVTDVNNTKMNSLNNSSQKGVTDMNSQRMNSLNSSSQKGVTDMNSQRMNSLNNSSQKGVTNVNDQKHNSTQLTLRPQEPTDGYSQKMKKLKNLLQHGVPEDDPNLIQLIRTDFVFLPEEKPYNLKNPDVRDYSCGQSVAIDNVLSQMAKPKPREHDDKLPNSVRELIIRPSVVRSEHGMVNVQSHVRYCVQTCYYVLKDFTEALQPTSKSPSSTTDLFFTIVEALAIVDLDSSADGSQEKGFYIEAGAYDGESISNTLFFEKVRKWNGLLIEPDPFVFERLKAKNRKAILVNSCLNIKPQPSILEFNRGNEMGRVWVDKEDKNWVKEMTMQVNVIEVPCFSLYSILLAVNQTTIDYFSLDIEGRELSVLQSIPFDKLHIDTFTVEYLNGNDNNYYKDIKSFMEKNGYQHVQDLPGFGTCVARDSLFKKK